MPYLVESTPFLDRKLKKLAKKDRQQFERVQSKVCEILQDPHHYKDLSFPLQGQKRVHIGNFVLTFAIDGTRRAVILIDYDHHDKIYKS